MKTKWVIFVAALVGTVLSAEQDKVSRRSTHLLDGSDSDSDPDLTEDPYLPINPDQQEQRTEEHAGSAPILSLTRYQPIVSLVNHHHLVNENFLRLMQQPLDVAHLNLSHMITPDGHPFASHSPGSYPLGGIFNGGSGGHTSLGSYPLGGIFNGGPGQQVSLPLGVPRVFLIGVVAGRVPQPHVHYTNTYAVPVPVPHPINVDRPVPVPVPEPVPYNVDAPYPVRVARPYAVPVDKPVPVAVDRPYTVPVPQAVPVAVDRPVAHYVPQPVPYYVQRPVPVAAHEGAVGHSVSIQHPASVGHSVTIQHPAEVGHSSSYSHVYNYNKYNKYNDYNEYNHYRDIDLQGY